MRADTPSLVFGLVAALANAVGGLMVTSKKAWNQALLKDFIALGAGFMLTAVFLEFIPESIALDPEAAPPLILGGYLLIHFFEHTLASHFHFGEETHPEAFVEPAVSFFAFFGLLIHTFFDGVSIAAGFGVSHSLGILIFVAIFLHKIPEGFTIASIVLAAGQGRRRALGAAICLGLSTLLGVLGSAPLGGLLGPRLAVSAGVMIYVAASDLVPEVNREKGLRTALLVFVGVALFVATERLLHSFGL